MPSIVVYAAPTRSLRETSSVSSASISLISALTSAIISSRTVSASILSTSDFIFSMRAIARSSIADGSGMRPLSASSFASRSSSIWFIASLSSGVPPQELTMPSRESRSLSISSSALTILLDRSPATLEPVPMALLTEPTVLPALIITSPASFIVAAETSIRFPVCVNRFLTEPRMTFSS